MLERVDVVIPVYKPDDKLFRLIDSLYRQKHLPGRLQIMLTLSGEEEECEKLTEKLLAMRDACSGAQSVEVSVESLEKAAFDHGGTRNRGIALCEAPYVLCMTQDAVPCDRSLLARMLEAMKQQANAATVYARQVVGSSADILARLTQNFNYPDKSCVKSRLQYKTLGIKAIFCSDVCCLYRKEVFEQLKGFEEGLLFGEDTLYAKKALDAGYTIVYDASAKVEHWHEYSMWKQLRRNFDIAVNQKDHPEVFGGLSSESEGFRYVKKVLKLLAAERRYLTMPRFILQSAAKYIGFFLGKHYKKLPKGIVRKLTGDPGYFERRGA